jgi:hypothetical protein
MPYNNKYNNRREIQAEYNQQQNVTRPIIFF